MCLHLLAKYLPKRKPIKILSSLTWRHGKKCKICVTIRIFKMDKSSHLPSKSSYSEIFSKNNCPKNQPLKYIFNIAVLNLWPNSLKNTYDGVQVLVNFHVTLFCLWSLVQQSYILSHHFAEELLLWKTVQKLFMSC